MAVLNWQDVLRVHFIHKPSLYIYWYTLYSPNIGNRVRIEGPPSKAMTFLFVKGYCPTHILVQSENSHLGHQVDWVVDLRQENQRVALISWSLGHNSKYQWSQWIPMVMLWSCVLMLLKNPWVSMIKNPPPRFGKLKRCIWTSPSKAIVFWEAHERDNQSTHKTTKRQNDTHFLNCFTGSQPRGEVSLKFLTEEVMFFSYQHFDVRFLLTIWSVDLVAWIIWIVESLNKQDKPKKIQQLSSLNDFKGSRC